MWNCQHCHCEKTALSSTSKPAVNRQDLLCCELVDWEHLTQSDKTYTNTDTIILRKWIYVTNLFSLLGGETLGFRMEWDLMVNIVLK